MADITLVVLMLIQLSKDNHHAKPLQPRSWLSTDANNTAHWQPQLFFQRKAILAFHTQRAQEAQETISQAVATNGDASQAVDTNTAVCININISTPNVTIISVEPAREDEG